MTVGSEQCSGDVVSTTVSGVSCDNCDLAIRPMVAKKKILHRPTFDEFNIHDVFFVSFNVRSFRRSNNGRRSSGDTNVSLTQICSTRSKFEGFDFDCRSCAFCKLFLLHVGGVWFWCFVVCSVYREVFWACFVACGLCREVCWWCWAA